MKFTEFFWDFDGTLIDTYPVSVQILKAALGGAPLEEQEALGLMKNTLGICVEEYARRNGQTREELMTAFRREEGRLPLKGFPPLPGIPETLRRLRELGCRHYLFTHRDHLAWRILEAHGLRDCFEGGVTQEEGFPKKPDPSGLLHLMRKANVSPEECVMIGDRPMDLEAGRRAGMRVCMLDPEGFFPEEQGLRCEDAHALAELIRPERLPL